MESMFLPFRRYAEFSGRSGRREYWMFFLLCMIVYTVPTILLVIGMAQRAAQPGSGSALVPIAFGVFGVFALVAFIPTIAVQVRRFHDQDRSGWMVLLALIPYLGGLIVLVFMCLDGTRGGNRFGPDPRDPYNTNVFG
ncbi:DUF805 domain-containing protein [Novosphingobium sp.]|uniref:DUF805 domain-containing protein n=1 Tax=Novosphingobium sp. TaxID=1874826 RepID=UPI003B521BD2